MIYLIIFLLLVLVSEWALSPKNPYLAEKLIYLGAILAIWRGWVEDAPLSEFGLGFLRPHSLYPPAWWQAPVTWTVMTSVLMGVILWICRDDLDVRLTMSLGAKEWLAYLPWSALQQFLLLCFIFPVMSNTFGVGWGIVASTAVFCGLHYPNPFLMSVTFAGGLGSLVLFVSFPNIIYPAIFHALTAVVLRETVAEDVHGYWKIGRAYLEKINV